MKASCYKEDCSALYTGIRLVPDYFYFIPEQIVFKKEQIVYHFLEVMSNRRIKNENSVD